VFKSDQKQKIKFGQSWLIVFGLVSLLVCISESSVSAQTTAPTVSELTGHWLDNTCISIGNNLYIQRDFTLTPPDWIGLFTIYGDANCNASAKQVVLNTTGSFSIGDPWQPVPNSRQAIFGFGKRTLTPVTQSFADFLNGSNKCGPGNWKAGQEQDISATGCEALGTEPVSACKAEYDLLQLKDGLLYLGDRSASLCDDPAKRPTKPGPAGLKKLATTGSGAGGAAPGAAPAAGQGGGSLSASVEDSLLPLLVLLVLAGLGLGASLGLRLKRISNRR
jgi:hypothetical protein